MNFEELTEALMPHRRLLLRGRMDEGKHHILSTALLLLDTKDQTPIRLDIDSGGGDAEAAWYIGDVIQSISSPVHGVVVGCAYSSAFMLLQLCDVRLALPNSRLMFHGVSSKVSWDSPIRAHALEHGKNLHERNLEKIARRSGQPMRKIRMWSKGEYVFRAQQGLELGFIDKILRTKKKTS